MLIEFVRAGITTLNADAIVNAVSSTISFWGAVT